MNVLPDQMGNRGAEYYSTGHGLNPGYVTAEWGVHARISGKKIQTFLSETSNPRIHLPHAQNVYTVSPSNVIIICSYD